MSTAAPAIHFRSLSQLTSDVQRPFAAVMGAVERLGIRPDMTIDSTPYYGPKAAARIAAALADNDNAPGATRRAAIAAKR